MNADDSQPDSNAGGTARDAKGPRRRHEDYAVNYSHEMTQETSDASGRVIVRSVPVLYGVLVGGMLGDIPAGAVTGGLVSFGLDLTLREKSLFRPCLRPVCPLAVWFARLLLRGVAAAGLTAPARLHGIRCGSTR